MTTGTQMEAVWAYKGLSVEWNLLCSLWFLFSLLFVLLPLLHRRALPLSRTLKLKKTQRVSWYIHSTCFMFAFVGSGVHVRDEFYSTDLCVYIFDFLVLIGWIPLHTGNLLVRSPIMRICEWILRDLVWCRIFRHKSNNDGDTWTFILNPSLVAVHSLRCSTVVLSQPPNNNHLPRIAGPLLWSSSINKLHLWLSTRAALCRKLIGAPFIISSSEMALIKHALEIGNEISVYCTVVMDVPNCFIWTRIYIKHASIF